MSSYYDTDDEDISRFLQFNEDKTTVTLVISSKKPMKFEDYLEELNNVVHQYDVDGEDLFMDNSFLVGMN